MQRIFFLVTFIFLILSNAFQAFALEETSQSFTLDGRAYSTSDASTPLLDTISTKIQILNQNQTCILYEETQSINTTATNGYFTIQVGSAIGAGKRSGNDSANSMQKVFSNTQTNVNGKLVSNGAACTYTPASGDKRYVRMQMTPASDSVLRTISPNMALDSVPSALVAERAENLQGLAPANLLQVNTSGSNALTQANLESVFSTTNLTNLNNILATPSASYIRTTSNGSIGIPSIGGTGNPTAPVAGQMWFDSVNGVMKYYDGAVKTVGTGTIPTGVVVDGGNTVSAAMNIGSAAGSSQNLNFITNGNTGVTVDVNGRVGIGTTTPVAALEIFKTQPVSTAIRISNLSNGVTANGEMRVYTDTESVGFAVGSYGSGYSTPAFIAGRSGLFSNTTPIFIAAPATQSITFNTTLGVENMRINGSGQVGVGTADPLTKLHVGTSAVDSQTAPTTIANSYYLGIGASEWDLNSYRLLGFGYRHPSSTHFPAYLGFQETDTTSNSSGALVFGTRSVVTDTAPSERMRITDAGRVGIGTSIPTALLNLSAGTATAGTAPLKLTAGTNLTAAEAGAIEFDGTNLYFTDSVPTRRTIATTTSSTFTGIGTIGNAGDITIAPTATTGSVLVNSGTPSISTGTGALVVTGGVGITNGLNMGGSFNLSGTGTHSQSYTGTATGASIAANSLTSGSILDLSSTSTAAAAGNTGLNIAISGANASAGITRTGVKSTVTATGATSTNVGASFSASGATNNYGLLVPSGRVGFGTSTPASNLHLEDTAAAGSVEFRMKNLSNTGVSKFVLYNETDNAWGGMSIYNSNHSSPGDRNATKITSSHNLDLGTNSGVQNGGTGAITFLTGGWDASTQSRMTIASDGNVGIGTTTPGNKLSLSGNSNYGIIDIQSTAVNAESAISFRSGGEALGNQTWVLGKNVNGSTNGGFGIWHNNATRVQIDSSGNMGIGTTTPASKLDVVGSIKFSGALTFPDGTTMTTAAGTSTGLTSTTDLNLAADSDANASGVMILSTAGAERMRISNDGNVGIGTTTPKQTSQTVGPTLTLKSTVSNTPSSLELIGAVTTSEERGGKIGFFSINGVSTYEVANISQYSGITDPSSGQIVFSTAKSNALNERMRLTEDGRLAIGTDTPANLLHVATSTAFDGTNPNLATFSSAAHDVAIAFTAPNAKGAYHIFRNGTDNRWITGRSYFNDDYMIERWTGANSNAGRSFTIKNSNGFVGIGNDSPAYNLDVTGDIRIASGSKLYMNTTAVCDSTGCTASPSDRRFKENIQPLENSLEKILKLQGVSYDWRDPRAFGHQRQIGLIAQDLETVFPEVVKTDSKSGLKSVMYDKLVAPLLEAMKELVVRIEGSEALQKREIASLKEKALHAESQVEKLKQENAAMKAYLCSKDPAASICR